MISKISAGAIYSVLGNNSSLIPLGIKDVANSCGLTAASYIAGDKVEGKDRFIDEFGTQAIWLGGIPTYKYLLDKFMFKPMKFDPKVDVRIFKDKNILKAAKEFAPTKEIKLSIEHAALNQSKIKGLTLAKFVASTVLTALTYFGLTKFRHKYTEKQITKDYMAKKNEQKRNAQFTGNHVPFSSAFSAVHKQVPTKTPSFTGGLQNFMFDPVKNLMIVDGVITGERLTHARNPQDFMGYVIKEGSFWLFMYGAGQMISNALEKHVEKKYNKSIDLDARVIESEELKEALQSGKLKEHLNAFKQADKSDVDIYKFAVNSENKNFVVDMAKKSDIIELLKDSDKVDTRRYIALGNDKSDDFSGLRGIAKKLEKLLNQYETSNQDTETFLKQVRKLKRGSVLKNIGACIGALGVLAPAIMLAVRKFGDNSDYQVKKDIEAKLEQSV